MFDAPEGLKGYVGEEDGFDPLRLSDAFDMVRRRPTDSAYQRCDVGVSAVHCALCRGSWVVPPVRPTRGGRSIGLHSPNPEAVPRC